MRSNHSSSAWLLSPFHSPNHSLVATPTATPLLAITATPVTQPSPTPSPPLLSPPQIFEVASSEYSTDIFAQLGADDYAHVRRMVLHLVLSSDPAHEPALVHSLRLLGARLGQRNDGGRTRKGAERRPGWYGTAADFALVMSAGEGGWVGWGG